MPVKITEITEYKSEKYRNGLDEYEFYVDDVINTHVMLSSESQNKKNESRRGVTSFQDSTVLHILVLTHIEIYHSHHHVDRS